MSFYLKERITLGIKLIVIVKTLFISNSSFTFFRSNAKSCWVTVFFVLLFLLYGGLIKKELKEKHKMIDFSK